MMTKIAQLVTVLILSLASAWALATKPGAGIRVISPKEIKMDAQAVAPVKLVFSNPYGAGVLNLSARLPEGLQFADGGATQWQFHTGEKAEIFLHLYAQKNGRYHLMFDVAYSNGDEALASVTGVAVQVGPKQKPVAKSEVQKLTPDTGRKIKSMPAQETTYEKSN